MSNTDTGTQELMEADLNLLNLCNCDGFWHVEGKDGISRYLDDIVAARIAAVLDRVDKDVIGENAHNVGSIPVSSAEARMNRQKGEQRTKLLALRKEVSANLTKEKP